MHWYLFIWPQKCDPSSVLTAWMWLLLCAVGNQWARARSNEYLLQLKISSDNLINSKGTKGWAVTLPQVRVSTWLCYPRSSLGRLWLVVLQSAPASLMLWQRKHPQLALFLLAVTSMWGEGEERGLEQRSICIVVDRAEWTQQSCRGDSLPFGVACSRESFLEGDVSWTLVSRYSSVRWVMWGRKIEGIHRSCTVRI